MEMRTVFKIRSLVAAMSCTALIGCGESDLIELQDRQLSEARFAAAQPFLTNSEMNRWTPQNGIRP